MPSLTFIVQKGKILYFKKPYEKTQKKKKGKTQFTQNRVEANDKPTKHLSIRNRIRSSKLLVRASNLKEYYQIRGKKNLPCCEEKEESFGENFCCCCCWVSKWSEWRHFKERFCLYELGSEIEECLKSLVSDSRKWCPSRLSLLGFWIVSLPVGEEEAKEGRFNII